MSSTVFVDQLRRATNPNSSHLALLSRHPLVEALRERFGRLGLGLDVCSSLSAPDPRDRACCSAWYDGNRTINIGVCPDTGIESCIRSGARALFIAEGCALARPGAPLFEQGIYDAALEAAVFSYCSETGIEQVSERSLSLLLVRLGRANMERRKDEEFVMLAAAHSWALLCGLSPERRVQAAGEITRAHPRVGRHLKELCAQVAPRPVLSAEQIEAAALDIERCLS